MTTPEPRVRVHGNWMECDHCGIEYGYYSRMEATRQAHRHAATCPALRLAALTRELEALRDRLTRRLHDLRRDEVETPQIMSDYRDGMYDAIDSAVSDLTVIIDRAGGTG